MIACASGAPPLGPSPTVIHYARFEEPFLRALHRRHGAGPFPLDLVCTHAIACRLLPELPRRTLRALAGYFGAAVPPLRRSADHVLATAVVWRHLVKLLAEREGAFDLAALRNWLAQPVRRTPRRYPLPRERRRSLPDRPGVYRLLRAGGAVLYVGKAASLRQRVSGHFHAGAGERALEMLTQARDVSCTETETTLEAALLEADEIKRLSPPFNVALAAVGRAVWFATADLCHLQQEPDRDHVIGPLASAAPFEALSALRAAVALVPPASASRVLRACAVGVERPYAPGPDCFAAGLARFEQEAGRVVSARAVLRLGARLWDRRHAEKASQSGPDDAEKTAGDPPARLGSRAGDASAGGDGAPGGARGSTCPLAGPAQRVLARLVGAGAERRRLLVLRGGAVVERCRPRAGRARAGSTRPRAHARRSDASSFDVASFDRLRVLTTELRALAAGAASIEVRLGPHVRLSAAAVAGGAALGVTTPRGRRADAACCSSPTPTSASTCPPARGSSGAAAAPTSSPASRAPSSPRCAARPTSSSTAATCSTAAACRPRSSTARCSRCCGSPTRGYRPARPRESRTLRASLSPPGRRTSGCTCFSAPSTALIEQGGLRVAFAGFPYTRGVREAFPSALAATGYRQVEADARVLCIHQCVEGAVCGPPPGFTFRGDDDVVRTGDLPDDVAAVLCGHVHRHQVLRRDLRGRPLSAPVVYAGSVERTSFAERDEPKGFVMASNRCRRRWWAAPRLRVPAASRAPDARARAERHGRGPGLEQEIRAVIAAAPPDVVLQFARAECPGRRRCASAPRLRALVPATANVTVSVRV